jgi:hypothetical protein
MKTIYKFELDECTMVEVNSDSRWLKVDAQDGNTYLWATIDTDKPIVEKAIHIYGTGHELPYNVDFADHIGTFFQGPFVWHAFDFSSISNF